MKKRALCRAAMAACMAVALAAAAVCSAYRQLMDDVLVAQYFVSEAENLGWQTVRVRVVVPEDRYVEYWTGNAIRAYVLIRCRGIPDRIDIVVYGSMEGLGAGRGYAEISFSR